MRAVKPFYIGVHGKARSGKDTFANLILGEVPGVVKDSFAANLKDGVAAMLGMPRVTMDHGDREKIIAELGFSVRQALQVFGTEGGRSLHPDIWVNLLKYRHKYRPEAGVRGYVIADVRFENEATFIRENGILCHVQRPGYDTAVGNQGHASEKGIEFKEGDVMAIQAENMQQLLEQAEKVIPEIVQAARKKAETRDESKAVVGNELHELPSRAGGVVS